MYVMRLVLLNKVSRTLIGAVAVTVEGSSGSEPGKGEGGRQPRQELNTAFVAVHVIVPGMVHSNRTLP